MSNLNWSYDDFLEWIENGSNEEITKNVVQLYLEDSITNDTNAIKNNIMIFYNILSF